MNEPRNEPRPSAPDLTRVEFSETMAQRDDRSRSAHSDSARSAFSPAILLLRIVAPLVLLAIVFALVR